MEIPSRSQRVRREGRSGPAASVGAGSAEGLGSMAAIIATGARLQLLPDPEDNASPGDGRAPSYGGECAPGHALTAFRPVLPPPLPLDCSRHGRGMPRWMRVLCGCEPGNAA